MTNLTLLLNIEFIIHNRFHFQFLFVYNVIAVKRQMQEQLQQEWLKMQNGNNCDLADTGERCHLSVNHILDLVMSYCQLVEDKHTIENVEKCAWKCRSETDPAPGLRKCSDLSGNIKGRYSIPNNSEANIRKVKKWGRTNDRGTAKEETIAKSSQTWNDVLP